MGSVRNRRVPVRPKNGATISEWETYVNDLLRTRPSVPELNRLISELQARQRYCFLRNKNNSKLHPDVWQDRRLHAHHLELRVLHEKHPSLNKQVGRIPEYRYYKSPNTKARRTKTQQHLPIDHYFEVVR